MKCWNGVLVFLLREAAYLGWLAMPLWKHSNGSKVHVFAPRGCEASSKDCPKPAERVTNSAPTGGTDRGSELGDGQKENTCLGEHPQEGFVCASRGFALRVSCTTDLNVANRYG